MCHTDQDEETAFSEWAVEPMAGGVGATSAALLRAQHCAGCLIFTFARCPEGLGSSQFGHVLGTDDYDGAIADSTKCIQLDGKDMDCYSTRSTALKGKGDLVNAAIDDKKVSSYFEENRIKDDAIRSSAKHYSDGETIPGVGTAMGDVYILPNGGCFGGDGAGIHWRSGAKSFFGATVSAQNPIVLVQAGSAATQK